MTAPPRSYHPAFADSHPMRYATELVARGREIRMVRADRVVATADTPGWAAQLVAAWNAECRRNRDPLAGLGKRQRRLLADMALEGAGRWPQRWELTRELRPVLESLHRRGLVTAPDRSAALTVLAPDLHA